MFSYESLKLRPPIPLDLGWHWMTLDDLGFYKLDIINLTICFSGVRSEETSHWQWRRFPLSMRLFWNPASRKPWKEVFTPDRRRDLGNHRWTRMWKRSACLSRPRVRQYESRTPACARLKNRGERGDTLTWSLRLGGKCRSLRKRTWPASSANLHGLGALYVIGSAFASSRRDLRRQVLFRASGFIYLGSATHLLWEMPDGLGVLARAKKPTRDREFPEISEKHK